MSRAYATSPCRSTHGTVDELSSRIEARKQQNLQNFLSGQCQHQIAGSVWNVPPSLFSLEGRRCLLSCSSKARFNLVIRFISFVGSSSLAAALQSFRQSSLRFWSLRFLRLTSVPRPSPV